MNAPFRAHQGAVASPPSELTSELIAREKQFSARNYDPLPVVFTRGEGSWLIDVDGRRYLDAISSLWVTTLGHCVPELDEAITAQVARIAHSTGRDASSAVTRAEVRRR